MARDHALACCAGAGKGVVRLYQWKVPTVSFGRNEPAAALYRSTGRSEDLSTPDTHAARSSTAPPHVAGLSFVRRPTGGRAVLHDRELTYAVAFPRGGLGGLREAYHRINGGLVSALRSLGVPAEHDQDGRAVAPGSGPCFEAAVPGEIVVGGRKLAGSAQARIGSAVLQHGSILLECDQADLAEAPQSDRPRANPVPAITLLEILGELPDWGVLVDAVSRGLASAFKGPIAPGVLSDEEARAEASLRDHYESPQWTWRR